ncbi:MAG TPA: LLM class flavin-dependent oxidoreductase [Nitrososphaeraceae archaeon]|nr:LLM class flavin-dependent oxidoreductase [Nitrososphaeraceae archaeon]
MANPKIIAQAFAELDILFPGRIDLGLGTGEAMNEVPPR